jgi:hypothetical protein
MNNKICIISGGCWDSYPINTRVVNHHDLTVTNRGRSLSFRLKTNNKK